jgi:AcrR family transcriptional regulator
MVAPADKPAADAAPAPRRRGRRRLEDGPALDRERLIQALLTITETEGLQAVNMRRVARDLGVSTRLIYHHVADKDEMIDLLADHILGRHLPDLSSGDWETRLRRIADASRAALARHPGLAAELLSRSTRRVDQPNALWVRRELRRALADAGLDEALVDMAYVQFSVIVLGSLVLLEGLQGEGSESAVPASRAQTSIDLGLDLLMFGIRRIAGGGRAAVPADISNP